MAIKGDFDGYWESLETQVPEQLYVGPTEAPDRYLLTRQRSRGGEGELWQGAVIVGNQSLPVAVKIIHNIPAANLAAASNRLSQQTELLRSIEHPNIVKVREVFVGAAPHCPGEPMPNSQMLYSVMNYVDGEDLAAWVRTHPDRDTAEISRIVNRLAAALDYLHRGEGTGGTAVLHRDVKPANVIVDKSGDVRLVDFGVACLANNQSVTVVGTPAFMAPEVVAGNSPTAAADRYGLGATAYVLFTGVAPNKFDPAGTRARLLTTVGITDPSRFADHIMTMLTSDPASRPTDLCAWARNLIAPVAAEPPSGETTVVIKHSDARPAPECAPSNSAPTVRYGRKKLNKSIMAGVGIGVVVVLGAGGIAKAFHHVGSGTVVAQETSAAPTLPETVDSAFTEGASVPEETITQWIDSDQTERNTVAPPDSRAQATITQVVQPSPVVVYAKTMYVSADKAAYVRSGPSTNDQVLREVARGTAVTVVGSDTGWCEDSHAVVSWSRLDSGGWIRTAKLSEYPPSVISTQSVGTVRALTDTNIRSGPTSVAGEIGTLAKGDAVRVLDTAVGWSEKLQADVSWSLIDRGGWVRSDLLG